MHGVSEAATVEQQDDLAVVGQRLADRAAQARADGPVAAVVTAGGKRSLFLSEIHDLDAREFAAADALVHLPQCEARRDGRGVGPAFE